MTTVGTVRAAAVMSIQTSGRSPNHGTLTGLSPEQASQLLRLRSRTCPLLTPTPGAIDAHRYGVRRLPQSDSQGRLRLNCIGTIRDLSEQTDHLGGRFTSDSLRRRTRSRGTGSLWRRRAPLGGCHRLGCDPSEERPTQGFCPGAVAGRSRGSSGGSTRRSRIERLGKRRSADSDEVRPLTRSSWFPPRFSLEHMRFAREHPQRRGLESAYPDLQSMLKKPAASPRTLGKPGGRIVCKSFPHR